MGDESVPPRFSEKISLSVGRVIQSGGEVLSSAKYVPFLRNFRQFGKWRDPVSEHS